MSIKDECEAIRGMVINEVCPVDLIPCHEISDPERLCKEPLVTVHMVTFNHEKYIAKAIESVLCQETDFDFELIIGDDASKDGTLEICKKFQQANPDKVRVLWAEENVYRQDGNPRRIVARSRGRYLAFCDGDDFWTDKNKLQRQVDALRLNPSASLCLSGFVFYDDTTEVSHEWKGLAAYGTGLIRGSDFVRWHILGRYPKKDMGERSNITPGVMVVTQKLREAMGKYEIFKWHLYLEDVTKWIGVASLGDVVVVPELMAAYRVHSGLCSASGTGVWRDSFLVRLYFLREVLQLANDAVPVRDRDQLLILIFIALVRKNLVVDLSKYVQGIRLANLHLTFFNCFRHHLVLFWWRHFGVSEHSLKWFARLFKYGGWI